MGWIENPMFLRNGQVKTLIRWLRQIEMMNLFFPSLELLLTQNSYEMEPSFEIDDQKPKSISQCGYRCNSEPKIEDPEKFYPSKKPDETPTFELSLLSFWISWILMLYFLIVE